jgi:hypothetical protein
MMGLPKGATGATIPATPTTCQRERCTVAPGQDGQCGAENRVYFDD